jgi:hypothetical protein
VVEFFSDFTATLAEEVVNNRATVDEVGHFWVPPDRDDGRRNVDRVANVQIFWPQIKSGSIKISAAGKNRGRIFGRFD